ncbi:duplicated orphan permease [Pedobacter steynii]|uniref:Duplicated orphan permease n=1 Tax=Pedobacter steynii TaxID=430522 RepID=A0A1H0M162_9SPHI|nr:ABC transporter permease [Pedobacter steynii]NQX40118.1 ABC transporter permease [Pedobacter steynii]SDO73936.1 duplicated orphan permease [Pedobacter steynii]
MFRLNLKIALRNLWKYKGYTAINIIGLSIGLAGCLLIFIFLKFQLSFDKGEEKRDRIYRIVSSWVYPEGEFFTSGVPIPLIPAMRNDFSEFEKVAAVHQGGGILKIKNEEGGADMKLRQDIFYVEPQFFEIFKIEWLSGRPEQALSQPNMVSLSEKTAAKYFGNWKNAIGKSIRYDNKADYKVTGVFKDFPENSSFPFEVVFSYASFEDKFGKEWGWVTNRSEGYGLLREDLKAADLEKPLKQFIDKHYIEKSAAKEKHYFQPLSEVHHDARFSNFRYKTVAYKELIGLGVIGLFLLITACINFVNLATAQAISRSKEVGIRKVMGSRRKQLIWQFLSETALITVISLGIACVLTELVIPKMESLMEINVSFHLFTEPVIFVFMLILVVFVSFLAGLYPALIMSGFSPALAIKNKISSASAGGLGLRKVLVVAQFTITAVLIIATLVVVRQMEYMREKSLGFDTKAVSMVNIPGDSLSRLKYESLRERLLQLPGVRDISLTSAAPISSGNRTISFKYDDRPEDEKTQLNIKQADEHYLKTFNLPLIAGRNLSKSDTLKEFVVNEQFLKTLGIANPSDAIGKTIGLGGGASPKKIVGVVKDFNNMTFKSTISSIAIFSDKNEYAAMAIKMDIKEMMNTMKKVEQEWNTTFPDDVYEAKFLDENIQNFYRTEQVMGVLFKVFAGVVIFISFIGLFGLVSFIATQKTREIAIRKVLGASTLELVKMLNRSFLWMVLIANLAAWPLAYIFASKWLNGFVYRIEISIWPFMIAMVLSVIITLVTVSLRSFKAANTNPIDALKYE